MTDANLLQKMPVLHGDNMNVTWVLHVSDSFLDKGGEAENSNKKVCFISLTCSLEGGKKLVRK